eukprot:47974-Eustigmatos_ZCMA.PRE.1
MDMACQATEAAEGEAASSTARACQPSLTDPHPFQLAHMTVLKPTQVPTSCHHQHSRRLDARR